MERRRPEYVVAVVEHGGFTAAVRALHVAQPPLPRSGADLERESGVELFHRVGRSALLGAAGEAPAGRARLVLRDIDALRSAARAIGEGAAGRVEVAATSSSGLEPVTRVSRSCASGTRASPGHGAADGAAGHRRRSTASARPSCSAR